MGFVDKSDRMVNSYGIAWRTWKWTKKLLFHLLDMTVLNAYLLHKSCGGKMTHKKFREILVRDLILQSHEANNTGQWRFSGEAKFIWGPTGSTGGGTFTTLANQRETKTLRFVLKIRKAEARSAIVKSVTLGYVWWTASRSGTHVKSVRYILHFMTK
ncbi:hypothetical protein B7P43_G08206 [Cryptotermes secundus]|uniref:PiggyBac transposable element-derived protein domain-containing protein n=1 Tax=Cryptotermes secundus TaxID=105785 RepID=A0A2J7PSG5_9NEOP|nr:hypothetical protein B7P43_G08206 [Cryptotermes secundus]